MASKKTETPAQKLSPKQETLLRSAVAGTVADFDKRTANSLVSRGLAKLTKAGVVATATGKKFYT